MLLFFSALILILFFDTQDFLGAFFGSAPLAVGCLEMLVPAFRKGYFIASSVSGYQERDPCLAFVLTVRFLERAPYSSSSFLATMMLFRCSASITPPAIVNSRKASSISLEENFSPQVIRECLNISASI